MGKTDSPANPVHSDFLVHWTGKDINACEPYEEGDTYAKMYIARLKSILAFGLWMNEPGVGDDPEAGIPQPQIPMSCFTELKLSQAVAHSRKYGGLGIGFKRFFVIDRGGLPVWYYPPWNKHLPDSIGKEAILNRIPLYLKPLGPRRGASVSYDYYEESEWRIVYSPWLSSEGFVQEPSSDFLQNLSSLYSAWSQLKRSEPKFLIPVVDPWFAIIIYPNIYVKRLAQEDDDLQEKIATVKEPCRARFRGIPIKGTALLEPFINPIQLTVDDCRNF